MPALNYFSRGVVLERHSEPAFSRTLRSFVMDEHIKTFASPHAGKTDLLDEELIFIAQQAQIIDETDGRPLYEKLKRLSLTSASALVVDAIDDQPYVSSGINPLLQKSKEVVEALKIMADTFHVKSKYIAVYKQAYDTYTKIPSKLHGVEVRQIGGKYPTQIIWEKHFSHHPEILAVGACALIHLWRAIFESRIQTSVFITVNGNCVATPSNIEVPIGTRLDAIFAYCGLSDDPNLIVIGGPMSGKFVADPSTANLGPASKAVLAIRDAERGREYKCAGCSRCSDVCPEGLVPFYIYRSIVCEKYDRVPFYRADKCITCGTCTYICPAKLPLAETIRKYLSSAQEEAQQ